MSKTTVLFACRFTNQGLDLARAFADQYQTVSCSSLTDGMQMIQKQDFRILVTDFWLGDGSGLDLVRRFHDSGRPGSVILMVEKNRLIPMNKLFRIGVDAMLMVPFNFAILESSLARLSSLPPEDSRKRRVHRLHARFSVTVELPNRSKAIATETFNVSSGGFFLILPDNNLPDVGTKLHFKVFTDKENSSPLMGVGTVRWCRSTRSGVFPRGVGISFNNPTESFQNNLLSALDQRETFNREGIGYSN